MNKEVDYSQQVLEQLSSKETRTPESIAEALGIGTGVVSVAIEELINSGYGVIQTANGLVRTRVAKSGKEHDGTSMGKYLKFGIVSDTHLASKWERVDALNQIYDVFEKEGITVAYNGGDLTAGVGVFKGQERELKYFGQQDQLDYFVKTYPKRKGIKTKFITGNHDMREFERGGMDIGYAIQRQRPDMEYLAPYSATIKMIDGVTMEITHPLGNVAYALSYRAQRDINNRTQKNCPSILVYGHFHSSYYMNYRGIEFIQAPCFEDQGYFAKRLGLNPTIGGWLVEGTINGNGLSKFKPTLLTY